MTELQAELLVDCKNNLGEGVQWSVPNQRVYWSDINRKKLYSCDEEGENVEVVETPERLGSFAFDPEGKILAAFETGLFRFDPQTGQADRLSTFEPDIKNTRLNDGRCDRDGRFLCGGYNETTVDRITSVCSYDGNEVRTIIQDIKCTNSICFSGDGTRMYFTDTPTKQIFTYDYNRSTGELGKRNLFATLGDDEGMPDGSCVDAEDCLWNAQYRGSRVQRFLPDGTRDIVVHLPVSSVTCACFGGKNLDRLFITTANQKLTPEQREQQPTAGGLFYINPGVKGREEDRFGAVLFP